MTDQQTLKTARQLLPLLDQLLGAKAPTVKRELKRLLAQAAKKGAKGIVQKILALLTSYPVVKRWMRESGITAAPAKKAAAPMNRLAKEPAKKAAPRTGRSPKGSRRVVVPPPPPPRRGIKPPPAAAPAPPPMSKPKRSSGGASASDIYVPHRPPAEAGPSDAPSFSGPSDTPSEHDAPGPGAPPPVEKDYEVVRIHFATDRKASGTKGPSEFFTGDRAPDEMPIVIWHVRREHSRDSR